MSARCRSALRSEGRLPLRPSGRRPSAARATTASEAGPVSTRSYSRSPVPLFPRAKAPHSARHARPGRPSQVLHLHPPSWRSLLPQPRRETPRLTLRCSETPQCPGRAAPTSSRVRRGRRRAGGTARFRRLRPARRFLRERAPRAAHEPAAGDLCARRDDLRQLRRDGAAHQDGARLGDAAFPRTPSCLHGSCTPEADTRFVSSLSRKERA